MDFHVRGGRLPGNPGGTPGGLYGEAPPERDALFRLEVYKRVGIPQVAVYKRVRVWTSGQSLPV